MLRRGSYGPGQSIKFYGLPPEQPNDRHKCFFSHSESDAFIRYRAGKNHMRILQMDTYGMATEGNGFMKWILKIDRRILLRSDLDLTNIYAGTLWAALEKKSEATRYSTD